MDMEILKYFYRRGKNFFDKIMIFRQFRGEEEIGVREITTLCHDDD